MSTSNDTYQFPNSASEAFFDSGKLKGGPNTYNERWVDNLGIDDPGNPPLDTVLLAEMAVRQSYDTQGEVASELDRAIYPESLPPQQIFPYVDLAGKAINAYRQEAKRLNQAPTDNRLAA